MKNEPLLVVMLCIVVLGIMLVQAMWIIVHSLMEIFKNVRYGKVEMYHVFIVILGEKCITFLSLLLDMLELS